MARYPYAAKQLASQVRDSLGRKADSKAGLDTLQPTDKPDGLGVHRTFRLDKIASERFGEALAVLDDPRIEAIYERDGQVYVRFTGRTAADYRTPFPLEDAATVAASEERDTGGD